MNFSMIYRCCDMIYGLRRMIYLLCKCDIISVPCIREAYIICGADIIALAISSVTAGNGYHWKNLFCLVDKRGFFVVRVKGLEPPRLLTLEPKSSASANSATPAKLNCQILYILIGVLSMQKWINFKFNVCDVVLITSITKYVQKLISQINNYI